MKFDVERFDIVLQGGRQGLVWSAFGVRHPASGSIFDNKVEVLAWSAAGWSKSINMIKQLGVSFMSFQTSTLVEMRSRHYNDHS